MRATTHPVHGPSLAGTPAGERLDGLLLRRLAARVGPAGLRYALGNSTVDGSGTGRHTPLPRPARARRAAARSRGPLRGCLRRRAHRDRGRPAGGARSRVPKPRERRAGEPARVARDVAAALAAARAPQRPPPLRPGQRLLRALARPAARLHQRLLRVRGAVARRGAGRQDGPRVPQARPAARRDGGGSRLRLGRPGAAHGTALRGARASLERLARADRVRAGARSAPRARRPRRVRRGRLPGHPRALRRLRLGRDARARGPPQLRRARHGHRAQPRPAWRARAAALHRPRPAGSAQRLDPQADLPRGLRADARRGGPGRARARRALGASTSRTCGRTTRSRCGTGASATSGPWPRAASGSTSASAAPGGSTWPAPRPPSAPASMQLFQVTFAPSGSSAVPWTRRGPLRRRSRALVERAEVLIVGGGPAGSACATALVAAGRDVLVVDQQRFPRDKPCAGWITPEAVERLSLRLDAYARDHTLQPVSRFRIGTIGGRAVDVDYGAPVSYGIRRCEFDAELLRRSGARTALGERVERDPRATGATGSLNGRFAAPVLVGAGGHFCPVARLVGGTPPHEALVVAQEVELRLEGAALDALPGGSGAAGALLQPRSARLRLVLPQGRLAQRRPRPARPAGATRSSSRRSSPGWCGSRGSPLHGPAGAAMPISCGKARDGAWRRTASCSRATRPASPSRRAARASCRRSYPARSRPRSILEARGATAEDALGRLYARAPRGGAGTAARGRERRPGALAAAAAGWLLATPWFARHVVLDRWFLHRQQGRAATDSSRRNCERSRRIRLEMPGWGAGQAPSGHGTRPCRRRRSEPVAHRLGPQAVEERVDDRHHEQRQQRRGDEPADHRARHRRAHLGARADREGERQHAEDHRERRHHDRPQPRRARLEQRLVARQALARAPGS